MSAAHLETLGNGCEESAAKWSQKPQ